MVRGKSMVRELTKWRLLFQPLRNVYIYIYIMYVYMYTECIQIHGGSVHES